jgi:hypothetical protein
MSSKYMAEEGCQIQMDVVEVDIGYPTINYTQNQQDLTIR